jgi:NAD(P)-dependent dehydrogenase (short-subunit alcohol dehydrogenase family)
MLRDKVAIVTGGGSGLGRATALAMARQGATIMLTDVDVAAGEAAAKEVGAAGATAAFFAADVTDEDAVSEMVAETVAQFGRLDVAYNSAGIEGTPALVHEQELAEIERTADVLLKGVDRCMKHEIRAMLDSGGGAIVNASSTWGLNAYPGRSGYITGKHAVSGLTKTAALELAQRNIRVNAVAPGPIDTPMLLRDWQGDLTTAAAGVPMGRIGRPEEVAEAVIWLCSDRASFVTGHILPVDGGMLCQVG